jgi:hypothetical protein
LVVGQEVTMLDTNTQNRQAQHTIHTAQQAQSEQLVVEQIMQPFMGNRDWAQLIAPRAEAAQDDAAPEHGSFAGELACTAGDPWLPDAGFGTTAFLSGLS